MAFIARQNSFIVFTLNRDVIVYDAVSGQHSQTTVPEAVKVLTKNSPSEQTAANGNECNDSKKTSKIIPGQITLMTVSNDERSLALTTHGDKILHLYRIAGTQLELISQRSLARAPSALRFTNDSTAILLADKTGDCYSFDCRQSTSAEGEWIFGHFSMILDILQTPDSKYEMIALIDHRIH